MLVEVNSTDIHHILIFTSAGISVPKPSKDETLEQLQKLPQQEEVRWYNDH